MPELETRLAELEHALDAAEQLPVPQRGYEAGLVAFRAGLRVLDREATADLSMRFMQLRDRAARIRDTAFRLEGRRREALYV